MKYQYKSIWDKSITDNTNYNTLKNDISTNVCIIGGGITGISTGYYLYKNNIDFIVLERNNICDNTTKFSSAKITSQHSLIYHNLAKKYGITKAKQYLYSNNDAIKNIQEIILKENIECDFKLQDSYVFTKKEQFIKNINDEYSTLLKLNFKDVELQNSIYLLPDVKKAIKFKNQAQFNPKKYCIGLSKVIKKNIFEKTNVKKIIRKGSKYLILTDSNKILCNKVILCTHFPIKDIPGFYFLKMYQDTSYIIAVDIGNNIFDGMYINFEDPTISIRSTNINDKNILLIGGNNIKTGSILNENKYTYLENIANSLYPNCKIIQYWNTQDCITLDKLPYIGKFSNLYPNIYIATGFNKWGMTTSNVAANILKDKILNKKNIYEDVYTATRFHILKNFNQVYLNINQTIKSEIINKLKIKSDKLENIPINTGKIIKLNNINVGVYKDKNNIIHKINPYCSHLKCLLTFNSQDKTWDCPCHGSRFDIDGNLLNGPANENIKIDKKQ